MDDIVPVKTNKVIQNSNFFSFSFSDWANGFGYEKACLDFNLSEKNLP